MLRHAISHSRLMRASTDRVQAALKSSDRNEQLIAHRILENPAAWSNWESEHSLLMRQLANCGVRRAQVAALKHTGLSAAARQGAFSLFAPQWRSAGRSVCRSWRTFGRGGFIKMRS